MQKKLLEIVVCPTCKRTLDFDKTKDELLCKKCELAFPIIDDIPHLIVDDARSLEQK